MPDVKLQFKNLEELKPLYNNLKLTGFTARDLLQRLELMFQKAEERIKAGDLEIAYITIMKYLNVFSYIQKTDDFKKDQVYFKAMVGKKPREALELAEHLHSLLKDKYDSLNNKQNESLGPDKTPQVEAPDMRVKKELKMSLTCAELFSMFRDGVTKVMLMDTRSKFDFENSRITDKMINIPDEIIEKGKSANMLERDLSEGSKVFWKQRGTYDQIVCLDWNSSEQTFYCSKLAILKDILTQWDINTNYKNEILILDGGYNEWLNNYPWNTTNPKPQRPNFEEVSSEIILDKIVYPELDDLNDSDEQGFLKTFFDRSKKPVKRSLNEDGEIGNEIIDREIDQEGRPNFDRAKKAAAIRTYEERKAAMESFLSQKEIETSRAIDLEKSMIDNERALQETIKQKEANADEEMKKILEEQEEQLLIKVEELREESIMKDNKIKELQKIIELYEKKDAEEMAKKQEDFERRIKEEELNLRIKIQEEEKKRLKKEREEMERMRNREKLIEEKYKEKLELARQKKKMQNENDVANNAANSENNYYSRPPTINRSIKPRLEEKVRQFSGVKGNVGRGLTGLKNLGNTCYMNSIMQCISNNSTLMKYFCKNHYWDELNRASKTRGEIAIELAEVIKIIWSGRYRSIACRDLKSTIGLYKSEYSTYEQQDSHEFLTFLMDWLHGDLNKLSEMEMSISEKGLNDAEKFWLNFKKKNRSLISTLFYGLQRSTLSCLECGESSVTYEPFSNLSVIIPDLEFSSVEQCLKLYMKSERISGWKCPKCQEFREAEKKTDIYELPPILVVHLKRFHYIEVLSRKRTTYVDFPLTNLNMAQYAVSNKQGLGNYNLYAVSNHYGTMEGGHYTAYCKNVLYKKWYKFDDHEVYEIAPNEVKTNAAYILFYTSISCDVPDVVS